MSDAREQPTPGAEWKAHVAQFPFAEDPGPPPNLVNVTVEQPTPGAGGAGDVGELERLARAANQETWTLGDGDLEGFPGSVDVQNERGYGICSMAERGPYRETAEFMVAAQPKNVLALIDRLRSAEAERDALRTAVEKIVNNWDDLHPKDLRQARAALARGPAADGQG